MRTRRDGQEELWPDFEGITSFIYDALFVVCAVALAYGVLMEILHK